MSLNIDIIKELMTEFCSEVYEALKGQYPDFIIDDWKRQVEIANMLKNGLGDTEALTTFAMPWVMIGQHVTPIDWMNHVVATDLKLAKTQQALAGLYMTSLHKVGVGLATTPTEMPRIFQEVIVTTQQTLIVFAQGDKDLEENLLGMLNAMQETIFEALNG